MATRFGGAKPTYGSVKLKWVLIGCGGILLLLVGLLVWVLVSQSTQQDAAQQQQTQQQQPLVAPPPVTSKIDVLVAKERIEEGTQFQQHLLAVRSWEPDQLPEGVVLAREINSILGKWAKTMISANMPILREHVNDQQPLSALNIPAGFRAVTITVDARSGVEGFARPNTRVDVLFTFTDKDGKRKVVTLCRFVKVLSVRGATQAEAPVAVAGDAPVTLLVTERDARKIELARNLGALSLALVGGEEGGKPKSDDQGAVDLDSIIGRQEAPTQSQPEEPAEGYMYTKDPDSGRQVRFKLLHGKWVKDQNF